MNRRTPRWSNVLFAAGLFAAAPHAACGGDDAAPATDAGRDLGGGDLGGSDLGGNVDGGPADAGGGDAGDLDAGSTDAGDFDGGNVDAGPLCADFTFGSCGLAGTACLGCPAGGPRNHFLCTTACTSDANCTDPARPHCNAPSAGADGICTDVGFGCAWGAVCASPDTMVATPDGERPISDLRMGDLVLSVDHGALRVVPLRATQRVPVLAHHVVRITLSSGRVVEMSEGHPTAEGVPFRALAPGMRLGDATIASLELVPYEYDATYDILPASDTGTYVAAGALVGTTMRGE